MTQLGVFKAIAAITGELAKEGIAKNRKNEQQHYNFRGIDDIYKHIAPLIAAHGLTVTPRVQGKTLSERVNKIGTVIFSVTVDVEYEMVSSLDGSRQTARVYGEAMDSGDKATNKAMSAAYKYFCIQTFCIPTEGDNDADATTHEVLARQADVPFSAPQSTAPLADAVAEFRSLVAQAQAKPGLREGERKFVTEQHARIAEYGDRVRPPTEKQMQWLRDIVAGTKRPAPAPVTRAAAQAIMDDAPPSWHNDPIEGEYGY